MYDILRDFIQRFIYISDNGCGITMNRTGEHMVIVWQRSELFQLNASVGTVVVAVGECSAMCSGDWLTDGLIDYWSQLVSDSIQSRQLANLSSHVGRHCTVYSEAYLNQK